MLQSLYIINKAGGLIFQQDMSPNAPKLSSNDHLRLGSTFHSMHAIASLVSTVAMRSVGVECQLRELNRFLQRNHRESSSLKQIHFLRSAFKHQLALNFISLQTQGLLILNLHFIMCMSYSLTTFSRYGELAKKNYLTLLVESLLWTWNANTMRIIHKPLTKLGREISLRHRLFGQQSLVIGVILLIFMILFVSLVLQLFSHSLDFTQQLSRLVCQTKHQSQRQALRQPKHAIF